MRSRGSSYVVAAVMLVVVATFMSSIAWAVEDSSSAVGNAKLQIGTSVTSDADGAAVHEEQPAAQAFKKAKKKLSIDNSRGWLVAEGEYFIVSAEDATQVLSISKKKAGLKTKSSSNRSQRWKLAFDYDTQCYTITNAKTGKVLTADNKAKAGSAVKETNLVKTSQRLTRYATRTVPLPVQRWRLYSNKQGYLLVSDQNENVALDIRKGVAKLVKRSAIKNARFWFIGTSGTFASNGLGEGTYIFQSAVNKKTLSITKSSVKENAKAGVGKAISDWGQIFELKAVHGGWYRIASYNSGMFLTAEKKNVVQKNVLTDKKTKDRQLWKLRIVGANGAVQFINKKTGKALTYNGKKLVLAKAIAQNASKSVPDRQRWLVSPTTTGLTDVGKKALYRMNKLGSKTQWSIAIDMTAHEFFLFKKANSSQAGAPWILQDACRCATGKNKCTWAGITTTGGMSVYRDGIGAKWCITAQHGSFIHSVLFGGGGNEQLGWFISHGCIRIPFKNAEALYKTITPGTRLVRWYK